MTAPPHSTRPSGPLQVRGRVLANAPASAYRVLTLRAPGVPERFRPGQFVAVAVGGSDSAMLGRRAFSVYDTVRTEGASQVSGAAGEAVRIVVAVHGPGTAWLADARPGDTVDVVGPLGRPFALPGPGGHDSTEDRRSYSTHHPPRGLSEGGYGDSESAAPREPAQRCVLVGGGYGSAPLFALADLLRDGGHRVDIVLGAATADRIFGAERASRTADSTTLTTVDGSAGRHGVVTDALPDLLHDAAAVYACGPMPMLRAVTATATAHGLRAEVAVEESMACGIGVCMTCVLPVVGEDGVSRMTRSCVEGPVFAGDAIRWNDIGTVPDDVWGARS